MIENFKLSPHFDFFEFTESTGHPGLVHTNRTQARMYLPRLITLAALAEKIRALIDCPMLVHSGFRYVTLNRAVGSTDKSQHLRGEALDFSPVGKDLDACFAQIVEAVRSGKIAVGQLIIEQQGRGYMAKRWIHFSLGVPWRPAEKCNQILTMVDGKYALVPLEAAA